MSKEKPTKRELTKILNDHKKWLGGEGGERANLSRANLSEANLFLANLSRANLSRANLSLADLSRANLSEANLFLANLSRANLSEANLFLANLSRANLSRANLSLADLSRANLSEANLFLADLSRANLSLADLFLADLSLANLSRANLPPPTTLLLCSWGKVSDKLTTELMRYDAANHPKPHLFQEWADGGNCPYGDKGFPRVAHFQENQGLWKPGKAKSARELALMLFKEKEIKFDEGI